MYKKLFAVSALLFLVTGCAAMGPLELREEKYGKSIPVITQSFASPTLRPRDTWKVYLQASDPDGDMLNIYATIFQPGVGPYPLGITRIKEGNRKELSGFVYLYTGTDQGWNFKTMTLTIQIQDKAGHISEPKVFPLAFYIGSRQQAPPPGIFQEKDLGPIMIDIRSSNDGGGHREVGGR